MPLRTIRTLFASRRTGESAQRYAQKPGHIFVLVLVVFAIMGAGALTFTAHSSIAFAAGGSGAALPYDELEAHSASTNGTILGPSYNLGDLASDAVDRQAVQLTQGKYVEFTLPHQANSINLRYSIPDSSSGGGITAPISIYINGVKQASDLQLTSKYSWLYGVPGFGDCNGNVWSNTPGGVAHHQFDEVHAMLPEMPGGTKVRLQIDSEDNAQWYAIDVADFQEVPAALTQPAGSISVTDAAYGADPTGATDSTQAIQNAVNAAAGKTVWIPKGTYLVTSHILVDNVTLTGAGPWYSILEGAPTSSTGTGVGVYGKTTTSSNITLSNFAIEGGITNRIDCIQDNGIGGEMANSTISNIWIEHTKVGMWFDGPFSGLKITGARIDSTTADGINFHLAITNSSVSQSIIRSTGDDSLALWPELKGTSTGDNNDTFDHNTIQSPYLANGIALYGGASNTVTNNIVTGAQYRGGGINLDSEDFGNPSAPFSGTTTISNNTIKYTAGIGDQGIQQFGALMFWADNHSLVAPFTVSNDEIDNSLYAAISFDGGAGAVGGPSPNGVTMSGINIANAEFAFSNKVNSVVGSATNVTASGLSVGGMQSCEGSQSWQVTTDATDTGWSPTPQTCGFPAGTPTPVVTPTPGGPTPTPVTPTPTPTPNPAPTGTLVTAINAGGAASGSFVADTGFNQGNQFSDTSTAINTSHLAESVPQSVWQTCRWNASFTYTIPNLTAGTNYNVVLDWAELSFQTAGARVFNVAINGTSKLTNFDVYATAGYKTAVQRSFTVPANSSGQIVIAFTQAGADNPFINGIEIWNPSGTGGTPTPTPTPTLTPTPTPTQTLVTAINAGGAASGSFVADTGFNQGNQFSDTSTAINTSHVTNPAPQAVWQTCRWNASFTYTLTGLTAGSSYTLKLDWAELSFQTAGARVFNVAVNGTPQLTNFDVYATAGYKTALQRSFTVTANSSGQIVIAFTQAGADNPFINGIELYH
ncbi:MAG TPA: malectin domain-containing carbohydrate-binding protein [Ktedonobacteraceae bacterium]|nr:malectin domain-containing carbohydrate-binding protein [Ktedonobacteraceae bacterium]